VEGSGVEGSGWRLLGISFLTVLIWGDSSERQERKQDHRPRKMLVSPGVLRSCRAPAHTSMRKRVMEMETHYSAQRREEGMQGG
jgi:hypothetical protein